MLRGTSVFPVEPAKLGGGIYKLNYIVHDIRESLKSSLNLFLSLVHSLIWFPSAAPGGGK